LKKESLHPNEYNEYQETLTYLFGLQRFGIKLGLANISALLQDLGDPHMGVPAIHIAGSNGKGSTAAFLASILRQAGYRVGLYTSPHLVDFRERIQIDGIPISADQVVHLTKRIRKTVERMGKEKRLWRGSSSQVVPQNFNRRKATITFFEFTTAMAFLYFKKAKVDITVLEAGMGGRLDATNVCDPLLSLITPISLEHRQYLGRTLIEIAGEKAGIIKPGRPLLTSARQPRVLHLFRRRCKELHSPYYAWRQNFRTRKDGPQTFRFQGIGHQWPHLRLGLAGSHQQGNAALALAAVEMLATMGFTIKEIDIRKGLLQVRWPGRLEEIGEGPRILLDGAHNPEGARALRKALQEGFPRRRLILVLGIMGDKDIFQMVSRLVPLASILILSRPKMERAAPIETLRAHTDSFHIPRLEISDVASAVEYGLHEAGKEDLILITGSLFMVGEARAFLVKQGILPPS
jgi:dihydrofolate synthase/folylpolyglutamate synthase